MRPLNFIRKVYPIIILTVVVFASVFCLGFVNSLTAPTIKEQENAAVLAPLKSMFPDMTTPVLKGDIYILKNGDKTIGYAFLATGAGRNGDIRILVALENETTVKGIVVISQSETPGLGDRVTLPSFTDKFIGMKIENIKLRTEGGQIDAISGSTISSQAVVDAVRNTALAEVQKLASL